MIGSDIRTFGSDRIRVSDRIRLNPYPIHIHSKKSDFIHIHYPVNGFFYYLTESDRVKNPRIRTHFPSLSLPYLWLFRRMLWKAYVDGPFGLPPLFYFFIFFILFSMHLGQITKKSHQHPKFISSSLGFACALSLISF